MTDEPLTIQTPLHAVVTHEGRITKLLCSVTGHPAPTCTWYKNGEPLQQNSRIRTICNERRHKLLITYAKKSDHGIYTIVCKNATETVISEAVLHVGSPLYRSVITRSYFVYPNHRNKVTKHLSHVKVRVGGTIRLRVEFKYEADNCVWCKNDQVIENKAIIEKNVSELRIENAKVTDSGIYTVVNTTNSDVTSSWAEVSVFDNELHIDEVPRMLEPLPEEIEVNEKEDIALMCRVTLNCDVNIKWYKDGSPVNSEKTVYENYGDNFIGLRIVKPRMNDRGEYSVTVRNIVTGHATTSSTFLTVLKCPLLDTPRVSVSKPLEPIVACMGSKVSFMCSFDLPNPLYYYVTWQVGLCEVERTNSSFKVITDGSNFILHIKQLEPDMASKITCELRKSIPQEKSILVSTTSAHLTIVPEVMADKLLSHKFLSHHILDVDRATVEFGKEAVLNGGSQICHMGFNARDVGKTLTLKNDLLITYCRMDEDIHFLTAPSTDMFKIIKVVNNNATENDKPNEEDLTYSIIWSTDNDENYWYIVDVEQSCGTYAKAGVTSRPSLVLQSPPLGRVVTFRIRRLALKGDCQEAALCMTAPARPEEHKTEKRIVKSNKLKIATPSRPQGAAVPEQNKEIQNYSVFVKRYIQTGLILGKGGFGTVELIKDKQGRQYAVKKMSTRGDLQKEAAMREYEAVIMLQHPKLVKSFEYYEDPGFFVICMEYLWGGELLTRIVTEDHFKEVDAVNYVKQILEGLAYMHSLKIAHLDLKPENIVCVRPNSNQIKIIDFGLARKLDRGRLLHCVIGTRDYIAPEMASYDRVTVSCDMWSLGVIVYVMLAGQRPAEYDKSYLYLFQDVKKKLDLDSLDEPSQIAKDFILKLCVHNVADRLTAEQALKDPWIMHGPPPDLRDMPMKTTRQKLQQYVAAHKQRWHMAGNVMRAAHRLRARMLHNTTSTNTSSSHVTDSRQNGDGKESQAPNND